LEEIFSKAPPSFKQTSPDQHVIQAYQQSQGVEGSELQYHERRKIEKDIPCPICFEEMFEKKEKISFCEVCGNNIHAVRDVLF
jgi:rRNA maturation endonuclease Nob1